MGYSFRLAVRVLLYTPSHRQDNTYHNCGPLAITRNSSMGPPWRINPTTHRTVSKHSSHGATSCSYCLVLEWQFQISQVFIYISFSFLHNIIFEYLTCTRLRNNSVTGRQNTWPQIYTNNNKKQQPYILCQILSLFVNLYWLTVEITLFCWACMKVKRPSLSNRKSEKFVWTHSLDQ